MRYALVLFLINTNAVACIVDVTWTVPNVRPNGSMEFKITDVKQFELFCKGLTNTSFFMTRFPKWNTATYSLTLKKGKYSCSMRIYDNWWPTPGNWSEPKTVECTY